MSDQDQSLRILHLAATLRWTGVAEPACSLALYQQRSGNRVWMACVPGRSMESVLRQRQISVPREIPLSQHNNPFLLPRDIQRMRRFLLQEEVQLIHSHLVNDHWLAALALRRLPRKTRPMLVRTVHRFESMRTDPFHRWLFETATDLVITVSNAQRDLLLSAYPRLEGRIRVIPGGVDPERFRPDLPGASAVRADLGESPSARVAGIVAHLGYNRGHKWLLDAAPAVLEKLPNAAIWIVGHGEIKRKLYSMISKPQFHNRVIMAGYRRKDLPETYCAMDVALLLGLGSEGSARATMEAMACERPVIALARGALLDTITDGENGILIPENDVEALSRALVDLLGNENKCREMGKAARQTILNKFTEKHRYVATQDAYQEFFSKRATTA